MIVSFSKELKKVGIDALRGGAYKPCTFPIKKSVNGWKEGLKKKGLSVFAPMPNKTIEAEITNPVFIDPSNERLSA